jgi:hypothetical protein
MVLRAVQELMDHQEAVDLLVVLVAQDLLVQLVVQEVQAVQV